MFGEEKKFDFNICYFSPNLNGTIGSCHQIKKILKTFFLKKYLVKVKSE